MNLKKGLIAAAGVAAVAVAAIAILSTFASQPAIAQETNTVVVGDLYFCDASFQGGVCETSIAVGDTVVWDFSGANAPHTTSACGASCDAPDASTLWESGTISDGSSFQFTFTEAGTYNYRCNIHPTPMRGQITVLAAQEEPTATEEPATPPADGPPDADPGPTVSAPPATGQGQGGDTSTRIPLAFAFAATGVVLLGISTANRVARRPR